MPRVMKSTDTRINGVRLSIGAKVLTSKVKSTQTHNIVTIRKTNKQKERLYSDDYLE